MTVFDAPFSGQMCDLANLLGWPSTRAGRFVGALVVGLWWLEALAEAEVRCPFCRCWYMWRLIGIDAHYCPACGELWSVDNRLRGICRPMRAYNCADRWAESRRRARTPLGWLRWQEARAVGRARNAWDAVEAAWQRLTVGYAYVEAWNLGDHLALYALPRLRHLRTHGPCGHPCELTEEEWEALLDDMIYALDLHVRVTFDRRPPLSDEEREAVYRYEGRYLRGLRAFGDYWEALWD